MYDVVPPYGHPRGQREVTVRVVRRSLSPTRVLERPVARWDGVPDLPDGEPEDDTAVEAPPDPPLPSPNMSESGRLKPDRRGRWVIDGGFETHPGCLEGIPEPSPFGVDPRTSWTLELWSPFYPIYGT